MKPLLQPFPMPGRRRAQAWRYQPQFRRPPHFHAESELNLVVVGSAQFKLGDRSVAAGPGTLLWFPPASDHALVEASPDLELFAVGFEPSLLQALAREHTELRTAADSAPIDFAKPPQQLSPQRLRQFANACYALSEQCDALNVEYQLLSLLRECATIECATPQLGGPAPTLGLRATSLVLGEPSTSRSQLARHLASNQGDVSRAFHRDLGITFREFRNRIRILEFLRRVDRGTAPLATAARLSGFGSYSQCHRVFREVLGRSPRDFVTSDSRLKLAARFEPFDCPVPIE